ncbi:MAG: dethiobiotin synthase [Legionella sp.]
MTVYFITGTDTDCGKTYVTCQLLDYFKQHRYKPLAIKPVASGCIRHEGQLINEDIVHLKEHNSLYSGEINRWQFIRPIAPHLAAAEEGVTLSALNIWEFCSQAEFVNFSPLLIEGAGGLCVPLNDQQTWLDFLSLASIKVILVVGIRLGCINHAILTEKILLASGIECVGWIANCCSSNQLALLRNIETLQIWLTAPLLAILPFEKELEDLHLNLLR